MVEHNNEVQQPEEILIRHNVEKSHEALKTAGQNIKDEYWH
jgi:hypothetical protein